MQSARGADNAETQLRLKLCCENNAAHPKSMYTHAVQLPVCKMQLYPLLCAANTCSRCLAVAGAGMLSPSLHHQAGKALLQGMRRWMSFLEGESVAALHIAALPGSY